MDAGTHTRISPLARHRPHTLTFTSSPHSHALSPHVHVCISASDTWPQVPRGTRTAFSVRMASCSLSPTNPLPLLPSPLVPLLRSWCIKHRKDDEKESMETRKGGVVVRSERLGCTARKPLYRGCLSPSFTSLAACAPAELADVGDRAAARSTSFFLRWIVCFLVRPFT